MMYDDESNDSLTSSVKNLDLQTRSDDSSRGSSRQFTKPGRFLENFNPECSAREMRKMTRRYTGGSSKRTVYDERGFLTASRQDLCDCLQLMCPGCHLPCPKCGSSKCGPECRQCRRWFYSEVEVEGTDVKYVFDMKKN